MFTAITTLFTVLTSGAGGGLLGGIFGLFRKSQDRKERVEMARISIERDQAEYANAAEERKHALAMLEKGAEIEVEKVAMETEAAIEVSHQQTLSSAQAEEFKGLNTTPPIDNLRASVRPILAYWSAALFTVMIGWAFYKYGHLITQADGKQILLGLFASLSFIVSSVVMFYFISRRNTSAQL